MVDKCKKGFEKVGKTCVSKKNHKRFGKLAVEVKILQLALIGALTSIGGWAIFKALVGIFGLDTLNDWLMLIIGLLVIVVTYKLGWRKLTS